MISYSIVPLKYRHPLCPCSTVDVLPNEIIIKILDHLSIQDRCRIRGINRRWRNLSLINITKLIVGDFCFGIKNIIPSFHHTISFESELKDRKMLQFFITNCGHSIRYLFIGKRSHDSYNVHIRQSWENIISSIPDYCPNIVGLHIDPYLVDQKVYLPIFQHYAPQLEMAYIHNKFDKPDHCQFVIEHFNPDRLRLLSLCVSNQRNLNDLANTFPHLSGFYPHPCWTFDRIDFSSFQNMTRLQHFRYTFPLSDANFRSLMSSSFVQNVQDLDLIESCEKVTSPAFELFGNLKSLRKLKIEIKGSRDLVTIIEPLQLLENLSLVLDSIELNPKYLDNGLKAISNLKHLKEFNFNLRTRTRLSFFSFQPMLCLTKLNLKIKSDFEDVSNEPGLAVLALPLACPNLIHFTFYWPQIPIHLLLGCIIQLEQLKSLTVEHWSEFQLDDFCRLKQIKIFQDDCLQPDWDCAIEYAV